MISLLLPVVLASLHYVNAAAYVGCFAREGVLQDLPGQYIYSGENPPTVECDCRAIGYDYQYSWGEYGGVGIYESCYCSNTRPDYFYYLDPSDYACSPGVNDQGGNVEVILTSPKPVGWTERDCYAPSSPGKVGTPVTTLVECLDSCTSQSFPYAALIVHEFNSVADCACYPDQALWQGLPQTDCLPEDWKIFSADIQPSNVARRNQRAMLNRQDQELCPTGTTACLLDQGGQNGFDCIDTSSELESCGGCTIGKFSIDPRLAKKISGIDCSTLPGVTANGVACFESRCVAFACEDGFTLVDDVCIPQ